MKSVFTFLIAAMVLLSFNTLSFTQDASREKLNGKENNQNRLVNPLYELSAGNFTTTSSSMGESNTIYFDLKILHTNLPLSGPFQFAAGKYIFTFNTGINTDGILTYDIVPGSTDFTNPDAIPRNPKIVGDSLILDFNYPLIPGTGPIISPYVPGTKIIRMKLSTTAPSFSGEPLNLRWVDNSDNNNNTEVFAFIGDSAVNISEDGTLIIDTGEVPLPVELLNFNAGLTSNNVTLNWSTSSETNNSGFDIERLSEIQSWEKIGFVNGNGTTSSLNNYTYEDKNLNTGIYNYRLKQIDYNGNFNYYYLSSQIYIGKPEEYSLSQNYPNPFNPVTKINYNLSSSGKVMLKVYDLNGKEVRTIVNEFKDAGYYNIDFNSSGLASGVYLYTLQAGSFTSTKKMIILK